MRDVPIGNGIRGLNSSNARKHHTLNVPKIASADCKPINHNNDFVSVASYYGAKNIAVTNDQDYIQWKSTLDKGTIKPPQAKQEIL